MTNLVLDKKKPGESERLEASNPAIKRHKGEKKSLSMHDGIPVWCDCCSCEAEPYWIEMTKNPGLGQETRDDSGKP